MTTDRQQDVLSARARVRQALGDIEVLRDSEHYWLRLHRTKRADMSAHRDYIAMLSVRISAGQIDRVTGFDLIAQLRTELLRDTFDDCLIVHELAHIQRSILALIRMDFGCHNG